MADIGIAAFAVFYLQRPSFPAAQAQIQSRQGRSSAETLSGIGRLPSGNHIRKTLEGVPPEHFDPVFAHVLNELERGGALGRLLTALDGAECFTSSRRRLADGGTQNCHAMLAASRSARPSGPPGAVSR